MWLVLRTKQFPMATCHCKHHDSLQYVWQTKKHNVQTLEAFTKHEFNRVVTSLTTRRLNVHVVPHNCTPLKCIDPSLYMCCNVIVHDYMGV